MKFSAADGGPGGAAAGSADGEEGSAFVSGGGTTEDADFFSMLEQIVEQ
jgi:hypothetical protein